MSREGREFQHKECFRKGGENHETCGLADEAQRVAPEHLSFLGGFIGTFFCLSLSFANVPDRFCPSESLFVVVRLVMSV